MFERSSWMFESVLNGDLAFTFGVVVVVVEQLIYIYTQIAGCFLGRQA